MRLARLAAAGLGIGVLAGFTAALLKPRPPALPAEPSAHPATGVPVSSMPVSGEPSNGPPPPAGGASSSPAAEHPVQRSGRPRSHPPSEEAGANRTLDATGLEAGQGTPGRTV